MWKNVIKSERNKNKKMNQISAVLRPVFLSQIYTLDKVSSNSSFIKLNYTYVLHEKLKSKTLPKKSSMDLSDC